MRRNGIRGLLMQRKSSPLAATHRQRSWRYRPKFLALGLLEMKSRLLPRLRWRSWLASVALVWVMVASIVIGSNGQWFQPAPALAQIVRIQEVAPQVYQRLPYLPLEDQNANQDTSRSTATLVGRMIQYHVFQKGRPANLRLDWKLTIADYLGANELMTEATYPGATTLRENPLAGDRAVIKALSRHQREELVQTLVELMTPRS